MEVRLTSGDQSYKGTSANICGGGMFVVVDQLGRVGEELDVTFRLPRMTDEIGIRAEVRWLRQDALCKEGRPPGMGIRFMRLSENDAWCLDLFFQSFGG
jgi:Tfp pilus assembly protein PilZ